MSAPPPRRVPVRTCVACRAAGGKRGLLRLVRDPATSLIALDPTGKRPGRGAYVCPSTACVDTALKRRALERSLKAERLADGTADALRAAAQAAEATPDDAAS